MPEGAAEKLAQELVADAEREARALSERTEEELKAYRDEQAKRAGAEASAEYDAAVAAARREAEAETSRLLENTDAAVGRIAGRPSRSNCTARRSIPPLSRPQTAPFPPITPLWRTRWSALSRRSTRTGRSIRGRRAPKRTASR